MTSSSSLSDDETESDGVEIRLSSAPSSEARLVASLGVSPAAIFAARSALD